MDTSDPRIRFDPEGRCNHCTEFLQKTKHSYSGRASDESLDHLFGAVRAAGRGKSFDCVIGVSGGTDSSFLAHIAKEHGLRPLAVHMDNGWNSEKAVLNIKNVTDGLGIDYESFVLDWEEFKDLQVAFLKASVPEAETPTDIAIPAALHAVAARYGIKYILSGSNLSTEGMLPASWHYDVRDMKYFHHIHRRFGTRRLWTFPTFGYRKEAWYKLVKGIRTVYPLDMVPYEKEPAQRLLSEKFGWRPYGGKHHESRYTKFIQSYYLVEKFGIDYRRLDLSMQICAGRIGRVAALDALKAEAFDRAEIQEDKQYIAKKLGLARDTFEDILTLPPKWYWDYPNDQRKLAFIYDTYRWVYGKEKLDRF